MSRKSNEPVVVTDYTIESVESVPSDVSGENLLRNDLKKLTWNGVGKIAVLATTFLVSLLGTITRHRPPERVILPPSIQISIQPDVFLLKTVEQSKSITPTQGAGSRQCASRGFTEIEDDDDRLTAFLKCMIAKQEDESKIAN